MIVFLGMLSAPGAVALPEARSGDRTLLTLDAPALIHKKRKMRKVKNVLRAIKSHRWRPSAPLWRPAVTCYMHFFAQLLVAFPRYSFSGGEPFLAR